MNYHLLMRDVCLNHKEMLIAYYEKKKKTNSNYLVISPFLYSRCDK